MQIVGKRPRPTESECAGESSKGNIKRTEIGEKDCVDSKAWFSGSGFVFCSAVCDQGVSRFAFTLLILGAPGGLCR